MDTSTLTAKPYPTVARSDEPRPGLALPHRCSRRLRGTSATLNDSRGSSAHPVRRPLLRRARSAGTPDHPGNPARRRHRRCSSTRWRQLAHHHKSEGSYPSPNSLTCHASRSSKPTPGQNRLHCHEAIERHLGCSLSLTEEAACLSHQSVGTSPAVSGVECLRQTLQVPASRSHTSVTTKSPSRGWPWTVAR